MVYIINLFINRFRYDTRCWLLMLGVLIAMWMFGYAVSAPIISIRPATSAASHIQLKITQQFATHFKTAKKNKYLVQLNFN